MEEKKLSTRDIAIGSREQAAADQARAATADRAEAGEQIGHEPLFPSGEGQGYRSRWDAVQTGFVDEPRKAVEEADALVADVMQRLARVFADERAALEQQWAKGDQVSTEELRVALRRYRSFFQRLLDV